MTYPVSSAMIPILSIKSPCCLPIALIRSAVASPMMASLTASGSLSYRSKTCSWVNVFMVLVADYLAAAVAVAAVAVAVVFDLALSVALWLLPLAGLCAWSGVLGQRSSLPDGPRATRRDVYLPARDFSQIVRPFDTSLCCW